MDYSFFSSLMSISFSLSFAWGSYAFKLLSAHKTGFIRPGLRTWLIKKNVANMRYHCWTSQALSPKWWCNPREICPGLRQGQGAKKGTVSLATPGQPRHAWNVTIVSRCGVFVVPYRRSNHLSHKNKPSPRIVDWQRQEQSTRTHMHHIKWLFLRDSFSFSRILRL